MRIFYVDTDSFQNMLDVLENCDVTNVVADCSDPLDDINLLENPSMMLNEIFSRVDQNNSSGK